MMYADVVMEKAEGIDPGEGKGIRKQLDEMLDEFKKKKGYKSDTEITADELKVLSEEFKKKVKDVLGKPFPDDAKEQLEGSIKAVLKAGMGKKLFRTAGSKEFLMTGEQRLMYRQWYLETWVIHLQQVLLLHVTLQPVKTFSTVSGW